ncbi:MAG: hypothetical protein JW771_06180 [Candidatus Thermoplasmatota archaeon]|nr:hypothetical protein [Candidatus Thermoplasmatota archaeon]
MQKKKESKIIEMSTFNGMTTLQKLQIIVSLIFVLSTVGFIIIFVGMWALAGGLILLSYLMIFGLMVKLLMTKKV